MTSFANLARAAFGAATASLLALAFVTAATAPAVTTSILPTATQSA